MNSTESPAIAAAETPTPVVMDSAAVLLAPPVDVRADVSTPSRRRPGRPLEVPADEVLETIRRRAAEPSGLFRVHEADPALYARARRLFGSWSAAVRRAGVDYELFQGMARARSLQTRRRNRRRAATTRR